MSGGHGFDLDDVEPHWTASRHEWTYGNPARVRELRTQAEGRVAARRIRRAFESWLLLLVDRIDRIVGRVRR